MADSTLERGGRGSCRRIGTRMPVPACDWMDIDDGRLQRSRTGRVGFIDPFLVVRIPILIRVGVGIRRILGLQRIALFPVI